MVCTTAAARRATKAREWLELPAFYIIEKYRSDDISYWLTELRQEDKDAIDQILEKYSSSGCSSRGPVKPILNELEEILR